MVALGGRAPSTGGMTGILRGRPRPRFRGGWLAATVVGVGAGGAAILGVEGFSFGEGRGDRGEDFGAGLAFFNGGANFFVFFFGGAARPARARRGGAGFRWGFLR